MRGSRALLLAVFAGACGSGQSAGSNGTNSLPVPTLDANDTVGFELLCATRHACFEDGSGVSFGACVNGYVGRALYSKSRADPLDLALAKCAALTPGDCNAIASCYFGPVENRSECKTDPMRAFCDGSHVVQCAGTPQQGGPLAPGAAHVLDCAHPTGAITPAFGGKNPTCIDAPDGPKCGVASCSGCGGYAGGGGQGPCTASPPASCSGDIVTYCAGDSVLTEYDCTIFGNACVSTPTAGCDNSNSGCQAGQNDYHCEGSKVVVDCLNGATELFADCATRNGWTCLPGGQTNDIWTVCGPSVPSCAADVGAAPGHCEGDDVAFCLDGQPAKYSCSGAGFGPCQDQNPYIGAWCSRAP